MSSLIIVSSHTLSSIVNLNDAKGTTYVKTEIKPT